MTYWLLDAIFLIPAVVLAILAARRLSWPAIGLTAATLLVMTAIFDNVMIWVGLVAYNESLISGVFVGVAPLEDFAYALAAIIGLPSLWVLLPTRTTAKPLRDSSEPAGRGPERRPRV
jgi:lycopene cyclase domain-containing protein